ncbi:uncharacterized protein LOC119077006 isoform X1 [Bradysia coprophila]|uniref:uncharacterized protein LOC119077006 isoform X1 n=1 Tax=Bradysia coprophila TaxID=38358 RepID=UPI00187D836F|nr:uncharacterized protein LOC119077006 isoform X1 [Bradysia coprophila]
MATKCISDDETSQDYERFKNSLRSFAKTMFWFMAFCTSIPVFCMCYVLLSMLNSVWLYILTSKYPHLDFVKVNKIRNILDSKRNQSVVHILLHIEGQCNVDIVKDSLLHYVLERTDRDETILYPKLRQSFLKSWGYYAWLRNESEFDINNHVILGPSTHMGRPVNENNIQEYVSNITSKYMPIDLPQWQIVLIPSAGSGDNMSTEKYFMFVRIHHLILAEEPDLRLSDFLLTTSHPTTSIPLMEANATNFCDTSEPFCNSIPTLVHIPKLYNEIELMICNRWNELLNRYGGGNKLEVKDDHGLFDVAVVIFIAFVTVMIEFLRDFTMVKEDTGRYFFNLCRRELERKNLSIKCLLNATLVSLHPKSMIETIVQTTFWITVNWCIILPIMWYREFVAIVKYFINPQHTVSAFTIKYGMLAYNATAELFDLLHMILIAPRKVYEELFEKQKTYPHALKNLSLCGRKVVSWSDKVSDDHVAQICKRHHITPNEVYFSAASSALFTFLEEFKNSIPKNLDACARYVEQDFLLGNGDYSEDITGYILVNLPLEPHSKRQIEKMRANFNEVRQNQFAFFLLYVAQRRYDFLTKILPQCWTRLLFNYLSNRYTVSITKLADSCPRTNQPDIGVTLWGDIIRDIVYFTPPQSNISVSLTFQRFGQHTRLAVMTDAIIRPFHNKISQSWSQNVQDMLQ